MQLKFRTLSLLLALCSLLSVPTHATQIVNVQYIHDYINKFAGVNVPVNGVIPTQAANVKYLLCTVDAMNRLSPGSENTNYCDNVLATNQAVDTAAVANAIPRMLNCDANGYFKNNDDGKCGACTNAPANAFDWSYTSGANNQTGCTIHINNCNAGYNVQDNDTANATCVVGIKSCTVQDNMTTNGTIVAKNATVASNENCEFLYRCDAGYYNSMHGVTYPNSANSLVCEPCANTPAHGESWSYIGGGTTRYGCPINISACEWGYYLHDNNIASSNCIVRTKGCVSSMDEWDYEENGKIEAVNVTITWFEECSYKYTCDIGYYNARHDTTDGIVKKLTCDACQNTPGDNAQRWEYSSASRDADQCDINITECAFGYYAADNNSPGALCKRKPAECPAVDPVDHLVVLPDWEGDGSTYLTCQNGVGILTPCPDGFVFNSKLDVCDWCQNVLPTDPGYCG